GYAVVLIALYLLLVALLRHEFFRDRLVAFAAMSLVVIGGLLIGIVLIEWVWWWSAIGHLAIPPLRPGFVGLTYGNPSAVLVIVFLPPIFQRVTAGGELLRLYYSLEALRMFRVSPIVGLGPGSWAIERPAFTIPGEFDDYVPYAHNLETQTLAELGIVGAAAG